MILEAVCGSILAVIAIIAILFFVAAGILAKISFG